MGNSKIEYFGETLIDLTSDSVSPDKVFEGVTAHDKAGDQITGTFTIDQELTDQESIISQMASALIGKARTYNGGGGGANIVASSGKFTPTEDGAAMTITHGLGSVPDLFWFYSGTGVENQNVQFSMSMSSGLIEYLKSQPLFDSSVKLITCLVRADHLGGLTFFSPTIQGHDLEEWDSNVVVEMLGLQRQMGRNTFVISGATDFLLDSSKNYSWVAIGGLV